MNPAVLAVAATLLLGFVMIQLAAMFRSKAGRWWAAAFGILACAQLLREMFAVHLVLEATFFGVLSLGCRNIVRTRFWKRKSTMYGGLLAILVSLDAAQLAAEQSGAPLTNINFGDFTLSVLLGCSLIMLMAEKSQWKLEKTLAEIQGARQLLEQRLHTDLLTQTLSRHAFNWIQQGSEIATEGLLSGIVVMFDVDGLKTINDTYGHHVGDLAIQAVANAIRGVIRGDDLLFRWGGDEFVAVLPNLLPDAAQVRLQRFDRPIAVRLDDGSTIDCGMTWGLAELGATSLDEAIRRADEQMYQRRQMRGRTMSFRGIAEVPA